MIFCIEESHHRTSDAININPSQLLRASLIKEVLFHFSRRSTRFYRLSHSEIVDIEKVAVRSSLRSPNNKSALIETFRVILCSIRSDEWKSFQSQHQLALCIWKAFRGNTRDLGSFREEMDKTTNLHQHLSRISTQKLERSSQITRDTVTTHLKTASQDL
ncbi:hypothetical protein Tco_0925595 [Tanacetum coccineum]|uniref:Uncharacterized protein n=1 Tax=Tanacetum coccineum TaxID=301880 RepID=A0ABQ5DA92_9ASTR